MRGKCFEKCITKEEGSLNFIDVVQYPIEEALQSHLYEFKNEIYTLSKIEHLNLVRLYEYLEHGNQKLIVVEYVANGNLREHLDVFCDFSESVGGCSQGRLKAINCFVLHLIAAARVISIGPQPLLHGCTVPT
ncbi:calmodulin-binding receptor cytoplasmic kinase [Trifolium repens]|nr:calmodulin-binding receptor cytoplasmic kinase [Trifolium repens]KAK2411311.1 calmodulin-binding receptor cytoplasmic kinase [Trifolium repens]